MRDIALQIDTYAEPTSPHAIEQAVRFAKIAGGAITGFAVQVDINAPDNWLAERLVHISDMARVEESKSRDAANAALGRLRSLAEVHGVSQNGHAVNANLRGTGPCMAREARTRDVCLIAVGDRMDSQRSVAEDVIFGSGRPVVVFHPEKAPLPESLTCIAIAWDGSRSATRAVGDALPLLKLASDVRVMTAIGEKASAAAGQASELVRHLRMHGVAAVTDEVDGRHRSIGASLDAYLEEVSPQLLVMGAYGSSRLKEFVLGGATEHILNTITTPVLLSH